MDEEHAAQLERDFDESGEKKDPALTGWEMFSEATNSAGASVPVFYEEAASQSRRDAAGTATSECVVPCIACPAPKRRYGDQIDVPSPLQGHPDTLVKQITSGSV